MSNYYAEMVAAFNAASGHSFLAEIEFITFRKTKRGILVGFTGGTPDDIENLIQAVYDAGKPYYYKNRVGVILDSWDQPYLWHRNEHWKREGAKDDRQLLEEEFVKGGKKVRPWYEPEGWCAEMETANA